jgi:hypothetical protein
VEVVTTSNATCGLDYPGQVPPRQRPSSDPAPSEDPSPPAGKGRPTPKRREAEAANRHPIVQDRKTATREQRAKDKAIRDREYQAMLSGDERYLPARDKGPVKRWVRDYVDSRRNPGEYFLPVAIVVVLATFFAQSSPIFALAVIIALYLVVIVTVIDALLLARRIKKQVAEKFGERRVERGIGMYGVMRAFQMRRTRLPKPQIKHGESPR